MKPIDLLKSLGNVKDSYVISAEEFRHGKSQAQVKTISVKRVWLIAAIVALMLLVVFLTRGGTSTDSSYHTHADGETHYGTHETTTTQAYHTHENGETHYDDHG